jgi:hypothetical protein
MHGNDNITMYDNHQSMKSFFHSTKTIRPYTKYFFIKNNSGQLYQLAPIHMDKKVCTNPLMLIIYSFPTHLPG